MQRIITPVLLKAGFCAGAFSLAAPVYISEIAENRIRGTVASLFQLMLVLGILFTYVLHMESV
jgi:SP family facilitated glucose transporter-like MFS transporter 8